MSRFKIYKKNYNEEQLKIFDRAHEEGFSDNDLRFIAKLNKEGNPIFSETEMNSIFTYGYMNNFPEKYLDFLTWTNNEISVFSLLELNDIIIYMNMASEPQINQLIDIAKQDLENKNFFFYMDKNITPGCMRLYHSISKMGCNWKDLQNMVSHNLGYDELKDIKYYLSIEKYFNFSDKIILSNLDGVDFDYLRSNISNFLCDERGITHKKQRKVISKCVEFRMEPEKLARIMIGANEKIMKDMAAAFLNGLSTKDMDDVINNIAKHGTHIKDFNYHFNEKIKEKIANAFPDKDYEEISENVNEMAKNKDKYFEDFSL